MIKSGYDRIEHDLYETPGWCVGTLMYLYDLPKDRIWWEPAAGNGAIAKHMSLFGYDVWCSDLVQRKYPLEQESDFLLFGKSPDQNIKGIITNPPFERRMPEFFITHANAFMKSVGGITIMLLRHEYDTAKTRKNLFTPEAGFAAKITLTKRPVWFPDREVKAAPRFSYAWYIWRFDQKIVDPIIRYGAC